MNTVRPFAVPVALALALALALPLGACHRDEQAKNEAELAAVETAPAAKPTPAAAPAPRRAAPKCVDCGTVTAIEPVKVKGKGSGAGAVMGAVAGAVIGHQFGSGRGNDAATATGAIAGGVAGHQVERRIKGGTVYRVTVAMNAGDTRVIEVPELNGVATGSKVKVVGTNLQLVG
jgi:uncharacterized protein YcfJ